MCKISSDALEWITIKIEMNQAKGLLNDNYFLKFSEFKQVFVFGLKSHLGGIIEKSNKELAMIIMTPLLSVESLGFFNLGLHMSNIMAKVGNGIKTVLVTKVSLSNHDQIRIYLPLLGRVSLFFSLIILIATAIISPILVPIMYGEGFTQAIYVFWITGPGILLLSFVGLCNTSFTQTGQPLMKSLIRGIGLLVNIIFLIILLKSYGLLGAAAALTLSYIATFIVSVILITRKFDFTIRNFIIVKKTDFVYIIDIIKKLVKVIFDRFR